MERDTNNMVPNLKSIQAYKAITEIIHDNILRINGGHIIMIYGNRNYKYLHPPWWDNECFEAVNERLATLSNYFDEK